MTKEKTLKQFDSIYKETYGDISKYVVCNCNNIEDVKDIIQNIYADVFKIIKKGDRISRNYLFVIARNKVKDYYRFHYKHRFISFFSSRDIEELREESKDNYDLEESITNKYDTERVWTYLKKKNVKIAKIFYLYYYQGLTIKEIAQSLDITESNVKHYLYRTLKELNRYLERGEQND